MIANPLSLYRPHHPNQPLGRDRPALDILIDWTSAVEPNREWVASLSAAEFGLLRELLLCAAEELLFKFRSDVRG
jgi:hypothetical protein